MAPEEDIQFHYISGGRPKGRPNRFAEGQNVMGTTLPHDSTIALGIRKVTKPSRSKCQPALNALASLEQTGGSTVNGLGRFEGALRGGLPDFQGNMCTLIEHINIPVFHDIFTEFPKEE